MSTAPEALTASQEMIQMITGYWVTQIIHGAAHFSLADHLNRQPMTATEFAKAEGIDGAASNRFLRACAAVHLVKSDGIRFFTTGLLDTLRRDHPQSLRGFALSQPAPGHWLPWGALHRRAENWRTTNSRYTER